MKHPAVMEVAVIGVHDEYRGESVKAYVILKEEFKEKVKSEKLNEIRAKIRELFA